MTGSPVVLVRASGKKEIMKYLWNGSIVETFFSSSSTGKQHENAILLDIAITERCH